MRSNRQRQKGRTDGAVGRHVRLYHWLMDTEAWRDLDVVAKCAYLELARRYHGKNNGSIAASVRSLAENLNVSKATAGRALAILEAHGFIVTTQRGAFSRKVRHATEFRLTEFASETGAIATKDFVRWRKYAVSPEGPIGPRGDTDRSSP